MKDNFHSDLRDYAWKYFALHADQRMKTFNFFLMLCAVIVGGMITLIRDPQGRHLAAPVGLALAFVSFVFWRLDVRNKQLIHHAEEALQLLEQDDRLCDKDGVPHRLKLFTHENHLARELRRGRILRLIPTYWSYSLCFNAVFLVFGLAGLISWIILLPGQ